MRVRDLYECDFKYLMPLFDECEYPWELLLKIKDYIYRLFELKPEGYSFLKDAVLVGKDVSISETATIIGPAIIGDKTEIRPGAFIRGSVIVCDGCVIGNSTELKNSILLSGAQVPHYNYVGDSVLGSRAHLGAGAVCSNLKADGKSVVIHGELEYETGLRKVGAFVGDGADIGCGCVLNPGTVVGKRTSVYPLTALRGVYPADSIVKAQNTVIPRLEK